MKLQIKFDALSKLREFKKGTDPSEYLSKEFRQVLKAVEKAYVTSSAPEIVFLFNYEPSLSGIAPLEEAEITEGKIEENYFYPEKEGRFLVEYSSTWSPQWGVAGTHSSTLKASLKVQKEVYSQSWVHTLTGGGIAQIDKVGGSVAFLTTLSPSEGICFIATPSNSTLTKFNCKISRIS